MRQVVRESNLIEGIDSNEEDAQSMHTWKWAVDYLNTPDGKIDLWFIRKLQKMITINQTDLLPNQRGYFRGEAGDKTDVRVGRHLGAPYQTVRTRMDAWLEDLKEEDSRWMHAMFEDIHPFRDGNGRTGRMVMWLDQLQRGEKIWVIKAAERQAYYDWLTECENKVAGI